MFIQKIVDNLIAMTRLTAVAGLATAVVGPFLLITLGGREKNHLPWYVWVTILLLGLAVIIGVFMRFRHDSHDAEDISIRPKNR